MNTSIEARIKIILGVAILLVVLMGGLTLYYSSKVNDNIETLIGSDIKTISVGQTLKSVYYDLKSDEKILLHHLRTGYLAEFDEDVTDRIKIKLKKFALAIQEYEKQSFSSDRQEELTLLKQNLDEYSNVIHDVEQKNIEDKNVSFVKTQTRLATLREEQDRIINNIISFGSQRFINHQTYLGHLISNANRNLFFLITLALLAGFIIMYLAPQRVTRPIRIFVNAIRELKELKFETRLPVHGKNELTELGREINSFVSSFVEFDEMKRKKIQFEKRRMQVLADILNLGVVVITIEGEVLFLNAQMAKFLNLSSESFEKKDFHFVRLPDELKDLFDDAIQKKEKFENRMIIMTYEKIGDDEKTYEEAVELLVDAGMVRNYMGDVANIILTFEDISDKPNSSIFKRISFDRPQLFLG